MTLSGFVVQLLNKKDGGTFTDEDQARFEVLAKPLGVILETCFRVDSATHADGQSAAASLPSRP